MFRIIRSGSLDLPALRRYLRCTQREFAGHFGFPVATLRHWERGNRKPAGASLVLLHVIADNPHAVLAAVRKVRRESPDALPRIEPKLTSRAPPGMAVPAPPCG